MRSTLSWGATVSYRCQPFEHKPCTISACQSLRRGHFHPFQTCRTKQARQRSLQDRLELGVAEFTIPNDWAKVRLYATHYPLICSYWSQKPTMPKSFSRCAAAITVAITQCVFIGHRYRCTGHRHWRLPAAYVRHRLDRLLVSHEQVQFPLSLVVVHKHGPKR